MHTLIIGGEEFSFFDICQAHLQLESDYNDGGWLQERPSNQRRNESTSCQLARMKYRDTYRWVNICAEPQDDEDPGDESVRFIYLSNVLKWNLPIDDEMREAIRRTFVRDWLDSTYPDWEKRSA